MTAERERPSDATKAAERAEAETHAGADRMPTEDEQIGIYRKLLLQLEGRPVTIRTFDLRPDKLMAYSQMSSSATRPFDWPVG